MRTEPGRQRPPEPAARIAGDRESGPKKETIFDDVELAVQRKCTDVENAMLLARDPELKARYVAAWRRWLVWRDGCWCDDTFGHVAGRARLVAKLLFDLAKEAPDRDAKKRMANHAVSSSSARRLAAMTELASTLPGIITQADEFDLDPWILNVANGVVDLRTGEIREHRQADLMTRQAPVLYDPAARLEETCPRWLRFLEEVLPDAEVRDFVQRAVGYSLTASTAEQVVFLLVGQGSNGKSVFAETLMDLLGSYAIRTPSETLLARRTDGIPNDVAALRGRRLVVASETEDGRRLAEGRLKQLTGGDTISARHMKGEWFTFRPVGKIWLSTNHRPEVRGGDHAIWRRVRLIPFEQRFGPEGDKPADKDLAAKLADELDGILVWAVRGALAWQRQGLEPPAAVTRATAEYREDQDTLETFVQDCCLVDDRYSVTSGHLYKTYANWCRDSGEKPESQRAFGLKMAGKGFTKTISKDGSKTVRKYHGLRVDVQDGP